MAPQFVYWSMACLPATGHSNRHILVVRDEAVWGVWLDSGNDLLELEYARDGVANRIDAVDGRHWVFDGQNRAPDAGLHGLADPGGQVTGEMQFSGAWPFLLRHALGEPTTSAGPGTTTKHVLIGRTALPVGFSLEKRMTLTDGTERFLRYLGCKIGELSIRFAIGEIPQCRATIVAGQETTPGASAELATMQSQIRSPHVHQTSITMDFGAGPQTVGVVEVLECLINNRLERGKYDVFNGASRSGIPVGPRTVSGTMRVHMSDDGWTLYSNWRSNAVFAVRLAAADPEGGDYLFQLKLPRLRLRGTPAPQVAGRGPVSLEFGWHAEYDATTLSDIEITLHSDDPSLSTM